MCNNSRNKKNYMNMKYIPSPLLLTAKEVAEFLNRPLLLSGEPGTGKTKFAEFISENEKRQLFVFNTKSVSLSKDLFYSYDAIGHFSDKEKNALEFINIEALGKAIVSAYGTEKFKQELLNNPTHNYQLSSLRSNPNKKDIIDHFLQGCNDKQSVVLIDEVDKAPRDFPNDILNEIENLEFEIKELNFKVSLDKASKEAKDKILVLVTSNFEKNLPEAFLRRCVYHHIEFPAEVDKLKAIINVHINDLDQGDLASRINEFLEIRKNPDIQKKPATSELIDSIKYIAKKNEMGIDLRKNKAALFALLKKNDDLQLYIA